MKLITALATCACACVKIRHTECGTVISLQDGLFFNERTNKEVINALLERMADDKWEIVKETVEVHIWDGIFLPMHDDKQAFINLLGDTYQLKNGTYIFEYLNGKAEAISGECYDCGVKSGKIICCPAASEKYGEAVVTCICEDCEAARLDEL